MLVRLCRGKTSCCSRRLDWGWESGGEEGAVLFFCSELGGLQVGGLRSHFRVWYAVMPRWCFSTERWDERRRDIMQSPDNATTLAKPGFLMPSRNVFFGGVFPPLHAGSGRR